MLNDKKIREILRNFENDYNSFRVAHGLHKEEVAKMKSLIKKDNSNLREVFLKNSDLPQACAEEKQKTIESLLSSTKALFVLLVTEQRFGVDLFPDYKIELRYKTGHDKYI